MAKQTDTKEKIVELAESFIRQRGYNAFSYQDISSNLQMKNAAIHYHFPVKEELGIAVIRKNIRGFESLLSDMENAPLNELKKLNRFIDQIFASAVTQEKICLVGALSTEYTMLPEKMKEEFQIMIMMIENWLTKLLKDGKRKKVFDFKTTAQTKAFMIITNMMAGLQLARVGGESCFYQIRDGVIKELSSSV